MTIYKQIITATALFAILFAASPMNASQQATGSTAADGEIVRLSKELAQTRRAIELATHGMTSARWLAGAGERTRRRSNYNDAASPFRRKYDLEKKNVERLQQARAALSRHLERAEAAIQFMTEQAIEASDSQDAWLDMQLRLLDSDMPADVERAASVDREIEKLWDHLTTDPRSYPGSVLAGAARARAFANSRVSSLELRIRQATVFCEMILENAGDDLDSEPSDRTRLLAEREQIRLTAEAAELTEHLRTVAKERRKLIEEAAAQPLANNVLLTQPGLDALRTYQRGVGDIAKSIERLYDYCFAEGRGKSDQLTAYHDFSYIVDQRTEDEHRVFVFVVTGDRLTDYWHGWSLQKEPLVIVGNRRRGVEEPNFAARLEDGVLTVVVRRKQPFESERAAMEFVKNIDPSPLFELFPSVLAPRSE